MLYQDDVNAAKEILASLHTHWDGKTSVLEMMDADYNWRQMEWGRKPQLFNGKTIVIPHIYGG